MPPGEITLAHVYTLLSEMRADLTRALERLATGESRHEEVMRRLDVVDKRLNAHADQIKDQDRFRWRFMGAALVVNFIAVVLAYWLIHH